MYRYPRLYAKSEYLQSIDTFEDIPAHILELLTEDSLQVLDTICGDVWPQIIPGYISHIP